MSAARRLGVVGVAGAVLVLGACTISPPGPAAPSSPESSSSPTEKPTADPSPATEEAVITVAAVDVDGLNVTISGYVSGLLELGGRCTFVLASGESEVRSESVGAPDRASTTCGSVRVATSELARGTWGARLEYTDGDGEVVVSDPIDVEVP